MIDINILKLQYQICELTEEITDLSLLLVSISKMVDKDKLNSILIETKKEHAYEDSINEIEEKKKELTEKMKKVLFL